MTPQRTEAVRMLIRLLDPFEKELRRLLDAENSNYENRSDPSRFTSGGRASEAAVEALAAALEKLGESIDELKEFFEESESEAKVEGVIPTRR